MKKRRNKVVANEICIKTEKDHPPHRVENHRGDKDIVRSLTTKVKITKDG